MRGFPASIFTTDLKFRNELKEILTHEEGWERHAYRDSLGKWTVGVGHNLEDVPLSDPAIEQILEDDLSRAMADARSIYGDETWMKAPRNTKKALVLMCFQLGKAGLAKFVQMKAHIDAGDYDLAAQEAMRSKWAEQTPARAARVAALMRGDE